MKLLSEDPNNYPDAPREGIRRVLEEVTGKPHSRDAPLDTSRIDAIRMGTTVRCCSWTNKSHYEALGNLSQLFASRTEGLFHRACRTQWASQLDDLLRSRRLQLTFPFKNTCTRTPNLDTLHINAVRKGTTMNGASDV